MKRILVIIAVVIGVTLGCAYYLFLSLSGYTVDLNGKDETNYKNEAIDNIESQLNAYKVLAELDNNRFEVVELSHLYGEFLETSYKPNTGNVFIYFSPKSENLSVRIVAFNPQGEKIALVESEREVFPVGAFILTDKGYYHFNSNLPSQLVEYEDISSSITKEQDLLKRYEDSEFFMRGMYDKPNDATKTYFFFNGNLWKKATISTALAPSQHLAWKTPTTGYPSPYTANYGKLPIVIDEKKNYKVRLDYFDKQQYSKKQNPVYGNPTGARKAGYWQGTGYFSLFMGDKTIKIKVPQTKLYSVGLASSITLYGNKALDFVIWRASESDNSEIYMIK